MGIDRCLRPEERIHWLRRRRRGVHDYLSPRSVGARLLRTPRVGTFSSSLNLTVGRRLYGRGVELFEWLGWRWLRRAIPLLAALIMLAVLWNDTSRVWLMEKAQHRVESRIDRVRNNLLSLFPKPTTARPVR